MDSIARSAINVINANPKLRDKLGWDLSLPAMTDRVDEFNAQMCIQLGQMQFVLPVGGQADPPPFLGHPSQNPQDPSRLAAVAGSVKKIWAGIRTLNEWVDIGAPAVPAEQSAARAGTCAQCPKNTPGDFSSWFTKPAAEGIRRLLERVQGKNLTTPHDAQLNVCDVCLCPMKLKVHVPLEIIKSGTSDELAGELKRVPNCWIIRELSA